MRLIASLLLFSPLVALADGVSIVGGTPLAEPQAIEDVAQFLPALMNAIKNGQWLMAGAVIAVIGTFLVGKYMLPKMKLGTGLLPLVSAVLGVLGGVGLAVANEAPMAAASFAVLSGPVGSMLWSAMIKYFFKKES